MKKRMISIMAVVMAAIFICGTLPTFAYPSKEKVSKDYRNMDIYDKQGQLVKKPTAQFSANRVVNGSVVDMAISYPDYDCNAEFPTLVCYVGDTLTFTDMSHDNNGGNIVEWDWQHFGSLGDHYELYPYNIVNAESYYLTEPGETIFYLCVKNDATVKNGCCDPWSENGNHQNVGRNKWFPKGAYWYFTAVRVVVKPVREAKVYVRYWDAQNNQIFHEGYVTAGNLYADEDTAETSVHITDWEGYEYSGWNVQLMDGTIQYDGTERDVGITLAGWVPEKYLNVEFYPYMDTGVEVRYWDKAENTLISSNTIPGEKVVREQESKITAELTPPAGYEMGGWNVQLPDDTIQYEGTENPVEVILNGYIPRKYLNVKCYPINDKKLTVNYIDIETGKIFDTDILHPVIPGKGDREVTVEFKNVPGYVIEGWTLKEPDDTVEQRGTNDPVDVTLTDDKPHKILNVDCLPIGESGDDDEPVEPLPPSEIVVKPSGICNGIITWTETDYHRVIVGYTNSGRARYRTCTHTFTYKATLGATAVVSPDVLKSGYGFDVNVACTLDTRLISNDGGCTSWGRGRTHTSKVSNPTSATVFIPWDMTNRLGTQSRTISMEPNGNLKFRLPISPVSEAGARKIYTPVTLPGTKEEPRKHNFEIYIGGGGVGRVEFCQKLEESITINGDMYEDDFSGAD